MTSCKLRDIVEKPITGEWGEEGGNVAILRTTNFTNELSIDYSKVVKRAVDQKKVTKKRLQRGDIILEKSGGSPKQPVGRVVYFDNQGEFLCNNFTTILRPQPTKVFSKYLAYQLYANHKYGLTSRFQNKTTGIINLKLQRYLDKTTIPLPPLDQQKKIAGILDTADAFRQKTRALITHYDALTQSLFLDMFGDPVTNPMGWQKVELNSCYIHPKEGTKCGPFGSALKKNEYTDSGVPVWTMDNITNGKFSFQGSLFISEKKYQELKKYNTREGDIIISRAGTVGKMCIVEYDDKAVISTNLIRLRLDPAKLLPLYFTTLMSNWGPRVARLKTGGDGAFTHMNTGILNGIVFPLPPINKQKQFARLAQVIELQKTQVKNSLKSAGDLFNCILQQAFKGELAETQHEIHSPKG